MKEQLQSLGWTCSPCNCGGGKGFDCVNTNHRGIVISSKTHNFFRIVKNSMIIETGWAYELEGKLKKHGLL
jgi:hypothetical protein